jgi:subtilase family serine protease
VTFAYLDLTAVGDDGDTSPLNISSANIFDINCTTIVHTVNNGSFTILSQDLVITQKSESWAVMEDKTYHIGYAVTNRGSGDAGASTTSITIDGVNAATGAVPALSPGESCMAILGPFTMTGDSDTIEVCADMDDVVSESNEENNCKKSRFEHPVPVPVLAPPGLVALIGLLMIVAVRCVKKDG